MTCWTKDCEDEGTDRWLSKPIGSFSIAGAQPKVVATRYVFCDEHWALVLFNLKGRP